MYSAKRNISSVAALLVALLSAPPVIAEEEPALTSPGEVAAAPVPAAAVPAQPSSADGRKNPFSSKPVPSATLASRRGGDSVFNDNKLKGVVADNKASNLTTGMNVISEGAFAGSSGLPTVIQNSGNNVLIQNSTIVNVQVK